MLFYCETCFAESGPKIRTVGLWWDHLHDPSHQTKTKSALLSWSQELNEKSWVITSSKQDTKLDKILTLKNLTVYFFKFGFVNDIYLDPERRFAVVQSDTPRELRQSYSFPNLTAGERVIEGIPVKLQKKLSVSGDTWSEYFSTPLPMAKNSATMGDPNFENTANGTTGVSNTASEAGIKKNGKETKKNSTDLQHKAQQGTPMKLSSNPPQPMQIGNPQSENCDENKKANSNPPTNVPGALKPQPLFFYNTKMQDTVPFEKGVNRKAKQTKQEPQHKRQKNKKGEPQPQPPSASNVPYVNFAKSKTDVNKEWVTRENKNASNNPPKSNVSTNLYRPHFKDFYSLFVDLPRMSLAARPNHKDSREFNKIDLDEQLDYFIYSITMTQEDSCKRIQLLHELTEVLKRKFPRCILYPFGSMSTGLGDSSSDIDIYVDIFGETTGIHPNPYETRRLTKQEIMIEIKKLLREARYPNKRPLYGKIIPVLSARVPILKFYHLHSKINVDLSFENLLSYQNTKMIHFIMKLDDRVKPLLLLVRYWGKFHDLTGSTLIKNYAFILMVLVVLARKGIIPKIFQLQSLVKSDLCIDGWNASFCEDKDTVLSEFRKAPEYEKNSSTGLPATKEILSLAKEFFHTCAHIDFSKKMICSLTAELLPKENFVPGNEENLPHELELYKNWSSKQSMGHRLNITTNLVLQDPFLLSFNVGGVTTEGTLLKFQVACAQTAEILSGNVKNIVEVFVPLPKQLGEKKFMAIQRIHKRHQKILQEIKEALCCGDTKPDSNDDATPVHLLPLEQIISKKTVQFGTGWESYQHYTLSDSTNKLFSRLFLKELKCLIDSAIVTQVDAENKLNSLWVSFIKEFLLNVWFPCFGITHTLEETVKPERRRASGIVGARRRGLGRKKDNTGKTNVDTNPFDGENPEVCEPVSNSTETETDDPGLSVDRSAEDKDLLLQKFNSIKDPDYCVIYYKFKCTSNISFWSKREYYRKQAFKTSESSTSKKEGKNKNRAEKRQQRMNLLSFTDPFVIEQEVMKLIDENDREVNSTNNLEDKKTTFQCNCWVKIDSSCIDDYPEVFILFEKDMKGFTQNYGSGGCSIATTLKKLLPDYMLFKLQQWMGNAGTNDPGTNLNESEKPEIEISFSDSDEEIINDAAQESDMDEDSEKIETPEL